MKYIICKISSGNSAGVKHIILTQLQKLIVIQYMETTRIA
jgi:hypothetical protein